MGPGRDVWVAIALASLALARPCAAAEVHDLFFGEALYQAYQGHFFDALARLDAELIQHRRVDQPWRDSLEPYMPEANFSVGDFELDYRMNARAGNVIKAVLEAKVPLGVRNDAAYRLARLYFQEGRPASALKALKWIHGHVPPAIRADVGLLRGNVYMALGRPAAAVPVLRRLQGESGAKGFAAFNLGIALLLSGRKAEGMKQLARAGRLRGDGAAQKAIIDKANMLRGTLLMKSAEYVRAQKSFDRVHLSGPYSNEALLNTGWAYAASKRYARALVPWGILAQRDPTDRWVQQAELALPYAYARLHVYGRAAVLYGKALGSFERQLTKVNASIHSIRAGKFLKDLVRAQIKHDRLWVVQLRVLPGAPETFYLAGLMASEEFQTALQNYLDLEELHRKLIAWQGSLVAFQDIVRLRRAHYKPLLPKIDARFRQLDSQVRLRVQERNALQRRLQELLIAPQPELLATADERIDQIRLDRMESALQTRTDPKAAALRARIERLKGVLTWRLYTEYPARLTETTRHLRALNRAVKAMNARYEAFVRARQAVVHSYMGYGRKIDRLRTRVQEAVQRVNMLRNRQGELIDDVAIKVLEARAKQLQAFETQARFAVADSYDRALKAQRNGAR